MNSNNIHHQFTYALSLFFILFAVACGTTEEEHGHEHGPDTHTHDDHGHSHGEDDHHHHQQEEFKVGKDTIASDSINEKEEQ